MPANDEADRVLLLSLVDEFGPPGGREMLSRTNLTLLRDLLGDRLRLIRPKRASSRYRDAWRGYIDGIDDRFIDELLTAIAARRITLMFVDGSNFGAAVAAVKQRAPHVRIITFFHNVEARFFWGSARLRRDMKSVAVLAANYLAERKAVRRSDLLICLSARDSRGLHRLYGRAADVVAPIVLQDRGQASTSQSLPVAQPAGVQPYVLFVGGGFYANIAGIRWFARAVAPYIAPHVQVVGRGMDELEAELSASPNVTLVGAVDDLTPWYAGAALVIAPIFDGSGMKTKVAEALMHGKSVVGTPEAFSGYADDVVASNHCCTDAVDFIDAINTAGPLPPFDPGMRALYERDHSPTAARARLAHALQLVATSPPTERMK